MATATIAPRPLPTPDVRLIDENGKPTPALYEYLKQIDALVRALRLEIP